MVTFLLLAGVLIIAGVVVIAVPLLRRSPTQLAPAPWAALGAAGLLVIGSAVLYATFTNWSWHAAPADDSPQTMVARLARKLERDPQDLNGWLMLGRSYVVLEQFPLALRAFERADRLAGGKSAEALVGEAEALTMADESELDGRAGRIIEQALALDPNSGKALFFGAAAAVRRGELALGKERFEKLLSMNPPEQIRPILQQQIDGLTQRMAAGANGGAAPAMAGAGGFAASSGSAAAPGSASAGSARSSGPMRSQGSAAADRRKRECSSARAHRPLTRTVEISIRRSAALRVRARSRATRSAARSKTTREPLSADRGADTSGFDGAGARVFRRSKSTGGGENCPLG